MELGDGEWIELDWVDVCCWMVMALFFFFFFFARCPAERSGMGTSLEDEV